MPHIQIQFRRDTSASWSAANPILASGEMGIELDTQQFKIGDGHTRWVNLRYGGIQGPPGPAGLILPSQTPTSGQVLTYIGPGNPPSDVQWRNPSSILANRIIIKAAKAVTNFDFAGAILNIPLGFGTGYSSLSSSDASGFSLTLNPSYNLVNFPIITGTLAYWDVSSNTMIYAQIKFGSSNSTNSVRAVVKPTTPLFSNNFGGPLTLTVDGITANAFTGVGNISDIQPLQYAITVYLQIMN
jgi:hypothetical protein